MRILYLAGPGDVIGTYRHWRENRDDPSQIAVTYSGQFYGVCREMGYEAIVVSSHPRREKIIDEQFEIEHRPLAVRGWRGPFYHLGQYLFHTRMAWLAMRRGCDVIVAVAGSHLTPFSLATARGTRLVLSEHAVLWPKHRRPGGLARIVQFFDRNVFRHKCAAIVSISDDISQQIDELTGGIHPKIDAFLPTYRRETFDGIAPPDHAQRPFRILFAGRIEATKGALELVEIAHRLVAAGRRDIVFDVAGDGNALAEMRRMIGAKNLSDIVRFHGYCLRPQLTELLGKCHAVIVPTTTEFAEGFNKVVAEAVLARRPFITSSVCPALAYVHGAGIEVAPDDIDGYVSATLKLADDASFYHECRAACERIREQFLDESRSWAAALKTAFRHIAQQNCNSLALVSESKCPN
jgi:glycosyltransferase involved in cell wall biosynthesis